MYSFFWNPCNFLDFPLQPTTETFLVSHQRKKNVFSHLPPNTLGLRFSKFQVCQRVRDQKTWRKEKNLLSRFPGWLELMRHWLHLCTLHTRRASATLFTVPKMQDSELIPLSAPDGFAASESFGVCCSVNSWGPQNVWLAKKAVNLMAGISCNKILRRLQPSRVGARSRCVPHAALESDREDGVATKHSADRPLCALTHR